MRSATPKYLPPTIEGIAKWVEVQPDGCWNWTGHLDRDGYGRHNRKGFTLAHRASYHVHVGPIPDGLEIDHLCRNRACVNPDHLEPVTSDENMHRGGLAMRTHCKYGHEFTPENTRLVPPHTRVCRACDREKARLYRRGERRPTAPDQTGGV